MRRDRISRVRRALGATIGVVLLVLGVGELVTHLDEPLSLFFWLLSLWGGGALILVAVSSESAAVLGAAAGSGRSSRAGEVDLEGDHVHASPDAGHTERTRPIGKLKLYQLG
jgi:hypothetical protein